MTNIENMMGAVTDFCFTTGIRDGYDKEEILDLICELPIADLYDALCDRAEPVYAYSADSDSPVPLMYRSKRLFSTNATLLWREPTLRVGDTDLLTSRFVELWLLDDMTLAVASCIQTVCGDDDFVAEYREYLGERWPAVEPMPELTDFLDHLETLVSNAFDPDMVVVYER